MTENITTRTNAWGTLSQAKFHDGVGMTAAEVLREANLAGWNLRKEPAYTFVDGEAVPMTGRYAVVRDNPTTGRPDVVGDVGEAYNVIQNEDHISFLDTLVDESGANFATAGASPDGKRVFVTMRLPGHISVGGVDRIDNYIAAVNSHDGSSSFRLMVTPIRLVCENMMNIALSKAEKSMTIRHTSGAAQRKVTQARQALDIVFDYLDDFQTTANRLINTELTQIEFEKMIAKEFGAGENASAAARTRAESRVDELMTLYFDSYTHEAVRDTAWAALNTLTEWSDHFAPVRGGEEDLRRADRALFAPGFKDRATAMVLDWAGVPVGA